MDAVQVVEVGGASDSDAKGLRVNMLQRGFLKH